MALRTGTQRARIYDQIVNQIRSGRLQAGERLPSMKHQAELYSTSPATVQQTIDLLAIDGYVEKRHGSGTYVLARPHALRLTDSIVLMMEAHDHLFGDLYAKLLRRLHDDRQTAMVVDTSHGQSDDMVRRALRSESRVLVIHGGAHFRFDLLGEGALDGKTVIGVIDWESDRWRDRAHTVLVDHRAGARQMATHLWEQGCRHALVIGPENMLRMQVQTDIPDFLRERNAFVAEWQRLGGSWEAHAHLGHPPPRPAPFQRCYRLDEARIVAAVRAAPKPCAVVGLMDTHAWEAQQALISRAPELLPDVVIMGYGNTPWRHFGQPPFASIDWNLDRIAADTGDLLHAALNRPDLPPRHLTVTPTLVTTP